MELTVAYGKQAEAISLPRGGATCEGLAGALATRYGVAPATIKLLGAGLKSPLHLADRGDEALIAAGVQPGARLKMMASRAADVAAVQAGHDDRLVPGFEAELRRELRRAGAAGPGAGVQLPAGRHTFQRFEAWQRPGLSPPPGEALKLLHRLAADPGIVGVMRQHRWTVGLLSEMPPEGKVGVSPVCILGVNINKGQEISLRLRTDDLKGFRRYDRIRETLLHELAHMVWGEHDSNFKQLNSQLRRECDAFDWRGAAARSVAGAAFEGHLQYDLPPEPATAMARTAASSGQTLRQLAGIGGASPPADARHAAAEAAVRRAGAAGGAASAAGPGPGTEQQQQQQQQQPGPPRQYGKGDRVLYRQRDGSWVDATVVSVDRSVAPPSYGVQLASAAAGEVRETEAARLQPAAPPPPPEVEGLGHRDAATEGLEERVARLEGR